VGKGKAGSGREKKEKGHPLAKVKVFLLLKKVSKMGEMHSQEKKKIAH